MFIMFKYNRASYVLVVVFLFFFLALAVWIVMLDKTSAGRQAVVVFLLHCQQCMFFSSRGIKWYWKFKWTLQNHKYQLYYCVELQTFDKCFILEWTWPEAQMLSNMGINQTTRVNKSNYSSIKCWNE